MFNKIFNKGLAKTFIIGLGVVLVLAAALITIKDEVLYWISTNENTAGAGNSVCLASDNVALVKIHGEIVNYKLDPTADPNTIYDPDSVSAEDITRSLDDIAKNDQIKGIIVEIDSPGGIPEAAEEIMDPLLASKKPVVAFIREKGLSAGYMIATAAERIWANQMSDVGSIGVTMSYLDNSKKDVANGLTYNQLSTGKFKDTGDPDKALTPEEKNLLMDELQKMHQLFVGYVAKNRNLDIKTVQKLADGSSMIAQDAKDAGLIDDIGGLSEAEAYLQDKIGEGVSVCNYQ